MFKVCHFVGGSKKKGKKEIIGWVRNRTSNRVEAEIIGEKNNIDGMLEKCRSGPPLAKVEDVIVNFIGKLTLVDKNIKGIKILETI